MLKQRSQEEEIMDDLDISGPVIAQTLRELNTINKWLGGNQISVRAFEKMARGKREIKVADLGCGGGDIMVAMARVSRKAGQQARFTGIDANAHIVDYAQKHTAEFPEVDYQVVNIFSDDFISQSFDIIHCCLFTHHFTSEELVTLFRQFRKQARVGVIINDLHRHPLAYGSIKVLTNLFSRSHMVRHDAAVSVARGFKRCELEDILHGAGIHDYSLSWRWAFRWRLVF